MSLSEEEEEEDHDDDEEFILLFFFNINLWAGMVVINTTRVSQPVPKEVTTDIQRGVSSSSPKRRAAHGSGCQKPHSSPSVTLSAHTCSHVLCRVLVLSRTMPQDAASNAWQRCRTPSRWQTGVRLPLPRLVPRLIYWPSHSEMVEIAARFSAKWALFPGAVGAEDGTYVPLVWTHSQIRSDSICRQGYPANQHSRHL